MTFREMAASQGFCSGWWHAFGFTMCPTMFQRADDVEYWDACEGLDPYQWRTAAQIAFNTGLSAKGVTRALRLLVNDRVAIKNGRKYRAQ